jgi:hypothetical protein
MVMLIEYIIEILGGLIVDGHLCLAGCVRMSAVAML